MQHLSEERLYELSKALCNELLLNEYDEADLRHIARCDLCYDALQCAMALHRSVENIGYSSLHTPGGKLKAMIRLAVGKTKALLEQLNADESWIFAPPLAPVGVRSIQWDDMQTRLEDIDSSESFLACDPQEGYLAIQLNQPAKILLERADGSREEIHLQQLEHLYYAEIPCPEEGEYRLLLEK